MSQLFKSIPKKEILIQLLTEHSVKEKKCYKLSPEIYKQMQYNDVIEPFLKLIKPHYHTSKQSYVDRKMTYPRFITILRHICKCHEINYTSIIKYSNSYYQIDYLFYINSIENNELSSYKATIND